MSDAPRQHPRVTRLSTEVMSGAPRQHPRVSRISVEVMADAPSRIRTTRVSTEVLGEPRHHPRITRMAVEVMAPPWPSIQALPIDPLQDFFVHNWVDAISIETYAPSALSASSETLAEARMGHLDKPYRVVKCRWVGLGQAVTQKLWGRLLYIGDHTIEAPLYCDYTIAGASCTTRILYGDFSSRRFHNGGKVAVYYADETVQVAIMVSASANTLILSGLDDLDVAPSEGDVLVPVLDVWPNLKETMALRTDRVGDLSVAFSELPGPSSLPYSAQGSPEGFDLHAGLPIIDLNYNWVVVPSQGFARSGIKAKVGKAEHLFLHGPSPQIKLGASRQLHTHADAWKWINFFDSRKGRTIPFWAILPIDLWVFGTAVGLVIKVEASGKVEHTNNYLSHVAIYDASGFVEILEVDEVTEDAPDGPTWTISLVTPITASPPVTDIKWCIKARTAKDSYTEHWVTNEVATIAVDVTEVLNEEEVVLDNITPSTTILAPMFSVAMSHYTPIVTT